MPAQRQRGDPKSVEIDGDLPYGLCGVRVEGRLRLSARSRSHERLKPDRLDGPRLVIDEHQGDQARLRPDALGERFDGYRSVVLDRKPFDLEAASCELFQRFDHARMFNGTSENVTRRIAGETEDGEIVGLGRAAGEDHFVGKCAE